MIDTPGFLTKHEEYLQRYGYSTFSDLTTAPHFLVPILEEFQRYGISSGGGDNYVAQAVHFDGATYLTNDALLSTDNQFTAFSFWAKISDTGLSTRILWQGDENGGSDNWGEFSSDSSKVGMYTGVGNTGVDFLDMQSATSDGPSLGSWAHWLGQFRSSGGDAVTLLYSNGNPLSVNVFDNTGAFTTNTNGLIFRVGALPSFDNFFTGDIADFWFAPGVSLLTGDVIAPATIAKFISGGKPVNLGASGQTPTGTAPAIFFSGDASAFANNKGTGGSFALTGSLTNATTSPSD